jgi:hypothetical protein
MQYFGRIYTKNISLFISNSDLRGHLEFYLVALPGL